MLSTVYSMFMDERTREGVHRASGLGRLMYPTRILHGKGRGPTRRLVGKNHKEYRGNVGEATQSPSSQRMLLIIHNFKEYRANFQVANS